MYSRKSPTLSTGYVCCQHNTVVPLHVTVLPDCDTKPAVCEMQVEAERREIETEEHLRLMADKETVRMQACRSLAEGVCAT